jgi:hypothetical protein
MADDGKAALQSERDGQVTVGQKIGNGNDGHNQGERGKRAAVPTNNENPWANETS